MSELKKVSVCPFCGSQLSSEHRNEYELAKQNAKLRMALEEIMHLLLHFGRLWSDTKKIEKVVKIAQEALK